MMRRLVSVFLACLGALLLPVGALAQDGGAAPDRGVTINVYNWGEYIANGTDGSMDVNAEFTRRTGIRVNYTTFDSNESLYSKLAGGGADYDVIFPSDYMVSKLIDEDMLAQLDFGNIPNFQYVDQQFRNPDYDPDNRYSVPYTWGVVGVFYNTDHIQEVTSWESLWDDEYAGKILMFDNPRDSFAIAQFLLGQNVNTIDPEDWQAAAELLKQQRPILQGYVMDQIFDKMENGEAWIAPYYAGDAAILVDNSENISFAVPEEGTNFFVDAACVPRTSDHQAEAEEYINFLCDPEIAGANMDYVGYSTPETAAKEYIDPEVAKSPLHYPSQETLSRTQVFVNLPGETAQLVDSLWAEVKMGGPGESAVLVAIILGFLGVYIAIIVYKRRKRKRELA
ncbi:spermidine/putrescine ABC transporter substrate-binding protein [Acutalibacter sp. 1XD8-33]|uniref:ABC transporter substrate-binding protein n=1 Tax=Acutalibacter sp. 1XD8-33 TaxID=2320081 RepID=UPI000EA15595|nr:spermidine/putrescine ABC transporter substrate-binding protein [Acutalibacter sp. 1XD8-33]RKJ42045.1 spermidine/putrescine ABC transporter substrate-binding protein [Acutalibacter sp. 1XD8-33]